jgi:predicted transcriptional regulator
MEIPFSPEQELQLSQIAVRAGKGVDQLVRDAALRLLESDARFREHVRKGIQAADRGELIEEAEMDQHIEQLLRS